MGTCSQKDKIVEFSGEIISKCFTRGNSETNLLLYEAVPVLLYEVPGKQTTSKALTHSADDQRQLLSLNKTSPQTRRQNPRKKPNVSK